MKTYNKFILILHIFLVFTTCKGQDANNKIQISENKITKPIKTGAEVLISDLSILEHKNLALVVNQTSVVGEEHLVDVLLSKNIKVQKLFAPEHGIRGQADAGEKVSSSIDKRTQLPIISLYGKHKKPSAEDLRGIDLVLFDIQDVGVRFYTYISTLHYVMEACAENKLPLIVLDRPNPNAKYIDGPVLKKEYTSFVGMHPVPILYGMTIGEYAKMINGELWLKNNAQCNLEVIQLENYHHQKVYSLPVRPSPNLKSDRAIKLYPSICFFEGTVISEGRGTQTPFEVFGAPQINKEEVPYSFTPVKMAGASYPKFENIECHGFNISAENKYFKELDGINLNYLISMYNLFPYKSSFFLKNGFFELLAGNNFLRKQIEEGMAMKEIKATWKEDIDTFKNIRKNYLLYP